MWPLRTRGPSGFEWFSTAEEVTDGVDGSGLTAIITGATRGVGKETARVLAKRGVYVIMAVRNTSMGEKVKEEILREMASAKVLVMELDVSSMASVRKFAQEFLDSGFPLNILINNAGIGGTSFALSEDGIEMQFATNYLGHFLLTYLLLHNMKETSKKSNIRGRIVNVASYMHNFTYCGGIRFKKLNEKLWYNNILAYGQSKLANILHSTELSCHFEEEKVNISANSLHPGFIATNIVSHNWLFYVIFETLGRVFGKNIQQGAATTCYVALHPKIECISGKFFMDCNLANPSSWVKDEKLRKKLWDFSLDLIDGKKI